MYGNTKRLMKMMEEAIRYSEVDEFYFRAHIRSRLYTEGTRVKHRLNWPINKFTTFFYRQVAKNEGATIDDLVEQAVIKHGWNKKETLSEFRLGYEAAKFTGQMLLR